MCLMALAACGDKKEESVDVPGKEGAKKTAALVRAERRLFDGAPPVIPHQDFGTTCTACHNERGMHVPDVGFAPPMPHKKTLGMGPNARCNQCHVFQVTDEVFCANSFEGIPQDLRKGERLNDVAPPVIPHPILMRENCQACHSGPAAREEIRCSHPERVRCTQCHVQSTGSSLFKR